MVQLTIFTPTYNRKELLKRNYEALCKQTCKDFIWMIIDDGSVDQTNEMVEEWIVSQKDFEIQYFYKENGGLHTAYNEAIAHIDTELCVCIDSDDYMPYDAVKKILDFWKKKGSEEYAGIVGLDYYTNGTVIGDLLPKQKSVNLIDLFIGKYNIINGDRTNVVRTELYKKYAPMKVFPGEKNFNPHYMHLQISKEYDFLVLNENLRFVEYQEDGMTNSMFKQYYNSPNSFIETRKLYLSFPQTSFKFKLRHAIHLVSSCTLAGNSFRAFKETDKKGIVCVAIPFGIFLAKVIKHKVEGEV